MSTGWAQLVAFDKTVVVIEPPETQYAETREGAFVAYQVLGSGPIDLLLVSGTGWHLDLAWEMPGLAPVFRRLAAFSRLIRIDFLGHGLSDPLAPAEEPTVEDGTKQMLTVLDAAGSERAAVVANGIGGLFALFFAASYPHRVSSLVLDGCYARLARAPDYPFGVPNEVLERAVSNVRGGAGELAEGGLGYIAPSAIHDPEFASQWHRYYRSLAGPSVQRAMARMMVLADLRPALSAIQAPTLVLYRSGDRWTGRPHSAYLAEHIEGAKLVELPGEDNLMFVGNTDVVIDEIEEFLTGARHVPESDRVLATVLFTDIVGSTERAAELGDKKWRDLLDKHDRTVRRQLDRFRGHEVNTAGDGFIVTFDGPGRAIECTRAIRDAIRALGIDVRAGLHTGEIEVRGDDVAGMAVHIGARVSALAKAGEILVSGAIPPLVAGSSLKFEYRGEHELKGVPGFWKVFAVAEEGAR